MKCFKGHAWEDCSCGFDAMIRESDHRRFWGWIIAAIAAAIIIGGLYLVAVLP